MTGLLLKPCWISQWHFTKQFYGSSKELDSDSYQIAYLCRRRFCPGSLESSEGRARGEAVAPRTSRNLAVHPYMAGRQDSASRTGTSIREILPFSLFLSPHRTVSLPLPYYPVAALRGRLVGGEDAWQEGGGVRDSQREKQVALA
jgi:hypothetical protein